jgi:predicted metal-binding protein
LNYHAGGTGIERVRMALPLVNGIHIHAALADVMLHARAGSLTTDVLDGEIAQHLAMYRDEVEARGVSGQDDDVEFLVKEQSALIEGLVRGWVKLRLPRILEEYEVVSVEEEMSWEMAPGLTQMLRLDGLLRHRVTGLLFILELKSVASPGYQWQQGWEKNIQFMSYTQAVREITGEECAGVVVEGLVKGIRRRETANSSPFLGCQLQQSPFCYAYAQRVKGTDDVVLQTSWARNATKVLVPDYVPMKVWVEELDAEGILAQQFVQVPPTSPLPEQILRWRRQTIAAETRFTLALQEVTSIERQIANAEDYESEVGGAVHELSAMREEREQLLDFHFPQHDTHCNRYGSPCSFYDACFEPNVAEDPVGSGLYKVREPHHTTELNQE